MHSDVIIIYFGFFVGVLIGHFEFLQFYLLQFENLQTLFYVFYCNLRQSFYHLNKKLLSPQTLKLLPKKSGKSASLKFAIKFD